jgi:hypothetical protein
MSPRTPFSWFGVTLDLRLAPLQAAKLQLKLSVALRHAQAFVTYAS